MPSALVEPAAEPPVFASRRRRASFRRRLLSTALRLALVVALSALTGGGWYLSKKGFSRKWRELVARELHEHGVEASVRRLTLDPFRGLIAQDVRIFDYKHDENTLAVISEVALDLNYGALFEHKPFLNSIAIRNATISFPVADNEGAETRARLKKFNALVYFPPEQIDVRAAEGLFCGVRISAVGQLIKRENYQSSATGSPETKARREALFHRFVSELGNFRFPGGPPQLQVKFSGDLSQLENAWVEVTLRGARIRRGEYEAREIFAAAEWREQKFHLTRCEWEDTAGNFAARGSWSRAAGKASFQARSTIDFSALCTAFGLGETMRELMLQSRPIIEASGSASIQGNERTVQVIGHFAVDQFSYGAVQFEGASANFSWDGARALLRDVELRHASGELTAEVFDGPGDFRLELESAVNPAVLQPLLPAAMQHFLGDWSWTKPPVIELSVRGSSRDPASWTGDGTLALSRSRFRGVWLNSATARVQIAERAVTLRELEVQRAEGAARGNLTYDFARDELRLEGVQSTLTPADAITWIDPKLFNQIAPYRFHAPPNVTADGVVRFGRGTGTRVELGIDAPAGMDYTFLGRDLPFTRVAARLVLSDERLEISGVEAALFSGAVRGAAEIPLAQNDAPYTARVALERVDFARVSELFFKHDESSGQLSGACDFSGRGADARTITGSGKVELTGGNALTTPIFRPLSELLSRILPGAAADLTRKASATFTIAAGVLHTDDFNIAGKPELTGRGDLHLPGGKFDLDVRLSSPATAGSLLAPLSKFLEFHGEGSLTKPVWRPKRF